MMVVIMVPVTVFIPIVERKGRAFAVFPYGDAGHIH
jgi:hypothetical protein